MRNLISAPLSWPHQISKLPREEKRSSKPRQSAPGQRLCSSSRRWFSFQLELGGPRTKLKQVGDLSTVLVATRRARWLDGGLKPDLTALCKKCARHSALWCQRAAHNLRRRYPRSGHLLQLVLFHPTTSITSSYRIKAPSRFNSTEDLSYSHWWDPGEQTLAADGTNGPRDILWHSPTASHKSAFRSVSNISPVLVSAYNESSYIFICQKVSPNCFYTAPMKHTRVRMAHICITFKSLTNNHTFSNRQTPKKHFVIQYPSHQLT